MRRYKARKGKNSPMQQPVNQGANTENINGSPALTRNRRLGQLETEHKNHLEQIESLKKDLETLVSVSFSYLIEQRLIRVAWSPSAAVGGHETR